MLMTLVLACASWLPQELGDLDRQLVDPDRRVRREAVQKVAQLDTLQAWKRVVAALADLEASVADEAQLQIAAIDDAESFKLLTGKEGLGSKDAWTRRRIAESFGRMTALVDPAVVVKTLSDKDADVRRSAVWSIERLRDAERWSGAAPTALIDAYRKDKDNGVRAAAFVALSRFTGDGWKLANELDVARRHSSYEVRAASVLAASEIDDPLAAQTSALASSKDEHIGVRLCVAEFLFAQRTGAAARALVDMLERETAHRARWRLVGMLRDLSGMVYALDPRPWRGWSATLPDGALETSKNDEVAPEDRSVSFAGMPILSERVVFLIDLSGSVWAPVEGGRTKKQAIDEELTKALRSLPPTVEFNLIAYTHGMFPWMPSLMPADKKNVAKAIEWFNARRDNGKGDFWSAFELALEDPNVDAIVVMTDGAPTGGNRWNLGLMRELLAEKNRFRRVVLDAVLADAKPPRRQDWIEMCASTGGRVVEIELR